MWWLRLAREVEFATWCWFCGGVARVVAGRPSPGVGTGGRRRGRWSWPGNPERATTPKVERFRRSGRCALAPVGGTSRLWAVFPRSVDQENSPVWGWWHVRELRGRQRYIRWILRQDYRDPTRQRGDLRKRTLSPDPGPILSVPRHDTDRFPRCLLSGVPNALRLRAAGSFLNGTPNMLTECHR